MNAELTILLGQHRTALEIRDFLSGEFTPLPLADLMAVLHAREAAPDDKETELAARRAVGAFLRAYAPIIPSTKAAAGPNAHMRRLPPHEL